MEQVRRLAHGLRALARRRLLRRMRPGSEDGRIVAFNLMENSDRNAALLIAGDGVAFVAFAVVGLSGHERQVSIWEA